MTSVFPGDINDSSSSETIPKNFTNRHSKRKFTKDLELFYLFGTRNNGDGHEEVYK